MGKIFLALNPFWLFLYFWICNKITLKVQYIHMDDLDFWNKEGYLIKRSLISDELIKAYEDLWIKEHTSTVNGKTTVVNHRGWDTYDVYKNHNQILDIFCESDIPSIIQNVTGEPAGLHLNFTGWVSTQKTWHQDVTIADKETADHYIGVWIALDNIDPNSGPFELIPKSHLWDIDFESIYPDFQRQNKNGKAVKVLDIYGSDDIRDCPPQEDPGAAAYRYYSSKLEAEKPEGISFTASKGDVLFWHGHTVHRGSEPLDDTILRKSIIGHLSGVHTGMLASQFAISYKNGYYF